VKFHNTAIYQKKKKNEVLECCPLGPELVAWRSSLSSYGTLLIKDGAFT